MRNPPHRAAIITTLAGLLFLVPPLYGQDDKDAEIKRLKDKLEQHARDAKRLELIVRELKLELSRVKVDNRDLSKALDDRNAAVLKLMDELKKLQNKAKEHENVLQTRQDRIDDLLKQVRELTLHVARLEAGGKGNAPRKQIEPNPPPVQVNGKITKVDGPLVAIDLGSDHGLKEHHTLEVYRLQPEPKYLGMIRIVDVMNTRSVARFVGKAPELKEGDQVSSKLK